MTKPDPATSSVLVRRLEVKISEDRPLDAEELSFLRMEIQTTDDLKVACSIISCFQWLNDPANIPYVIPYLDKGDGWTAARAIWTLSWLGAAEDHKAYMINAVEPGLQWDTHDYLANKIPSAAGHHLSTHRDRDFAQLLVRWRPRLPGDPFLFSKPFGKSYDQVLRLGMWTGIGMGYALGADSLALSEDDDLIDACVQRFMAERQDG